MFFRVMNLASNKKLGKAIKDEGLLDYALRLEHVEHIQELLWKKSKVVPIIENFLPLRRVANPLWARSRKKHVLCWLKPQ